MTAKKKENQDKEATAQKKTVAPAENASATEDFSCELGQPLWSVISFEKREAGGLTYDEAMRKIAELEAQGVSGLCIVTDNAAAKISEKL